MKQPTQHPKRARGVVFVAVASIVAVCLQIGAPAAHAGPSATYTQPMATMPTVNVPQSLWTMVSASEVEVANFSSNMAVNARVRWVCHGWTYQDVTVPVASQTSADIPWPSSFGTLPPTGCSLIVTLPMAAGTPTFLLANVVGNSWTPAKAMVKVSI